MNRIVGCALALALGGCMSAAPVPEDRFYRFQRLQPEHTLARPLLTGGLAVDDIRADPLHSARAMLYTAPDRPLQLQRYHYEFWVEEPPRLVHQVMISWLRDSGVADSVAGGDTLDAAWRLSARLLKFEEVRAEDGTAYVEVAMQFSLRSSSSTQPLWTRDYAQRRPLRESRMYATAQAMQAALSDLLAELQADLAVPVL